MSLLNVGSFFITEDMIVEESETVSKMLNNLEFIPLRVEFIYEKKSFLYLGSSPLFDELKNEISEVPEYQITMISNEAGVSVTANKRNAS